MSAMPEFDYSTLLAHSIHEVKNSLNMLLNSVDHVLSSTDGYDTDANKVLSQIQYEGKRVNDDLVGLLAIYRINNKQYNANIDEYSVYDFLQENIAQHEVMFRHRGIEHKLVCDENLYGFFDRDLITGVLSNVINNLYKYTKNKLSITAFKEDGYLVIKIKDNGPGYPEHMMVSHDENQHQNNISFEKANTGLGLYFSKLAAELHKNKGKHGYVTTTNDGIDGGGCFSIYLP
jgi:signal transduction histidine kinase